MAYGLWLMANGQWLMANGQFLKYAICHTPYAISYMPHTISYLVSLVTTGVITLSSRLSADTALTGIICFPSGRLKRKEKVPSGRRAISFPETVTLVNTQLPHRQSTQYSPLTRIRVCIPLS